ncbi:MAG: hypothetical protein AB1529_02730 [Candidatus Micrarchaeota archaeon]
MRRHKGSGSGSQPPRGRAGILEPDGLHDAAGLFKALDGPDEKRSVAAISVLGDIALAFRGTPRCLPIISLLENKALSTDSAEIRRACVSAMEMCGEDERARHVLIQKGPLPPHDSHEEHGLPPSERERAVWAMEALRAPGHAAHAGAIESLERICAGLPEGKTKRAVVLLFEAEAATSPHEDVRKGCIDALFRLKCADSLVALRSQVPGYEGYIGELLGRLGKEAKNK